ncbi:MAG: EutN/CcmL family microcompartment protein [Terriglobales bacterium]
MQMARVVGTVVATVKAATLQGQKLLLVQPLNAAGKPHRRALVALDAIGAGIGETVYYCRGKEASFPWLPEEVVTDATVVGIVDPPAGRGR